jgi:hypothetical protein
VVILGFVVLMLYLIITSNEHKCSNEENTTYNHSLNSFWITFNSKSHGNLIAVTSFNRTIEDQDGIPNKEFIEYFKEEVASISHSGVKYTDISIYNTYAEIRINHGDDIPNCIKNETVYDLIAFFKEKWYVLDADVWWLGSLLSEEIT